MTQWRCFSSYIDLHSSSCTLDLSVHLFKKKKKKEKNSAFGLPSCYDVRFWAVKEGQDQRVEMGDRYQNGKPVQKTGQIRQKAREKE